VHSGHAQQRNEGSRGVRGNGGCTPVVHQAITTVLNSSPVLDVQQLPAFIVALAELPTSLGLANFGHRIEFDTGPPPDDIVITFHRLVI
jgi:hypothetical protein